MTTTDQTTTCPAWCTSVGRFHDDTNAHDGPGWIAHGIELGTGTDERSEMTISIDATCALLTIDQAQQFAAALHKAITWARATSESVQPPAAAGFHLDGCTLDPQHRGACLLDQPFRIRPEGGREYVSDAQRLADAVHTLLTERRLSPEDVAAELEMPTDETAAALADLAHADSWWSYALAGVCGRQLSDVAREAGL